jgi:hypothetical protein
MDNSKIENQKGLNIAIKIGSIAYVVWGILHIYVGYMGISGYIVDPNKGLLSSFLGGANAPVEKFQFATDPMTLKVTANLILNFCLDVAGYGLLGIILGIMLWKMSKPWLAYLIGFFIIGLADLSFLFLQVTSGHIKGDLGTYGGPMLWLIAVVVLPFGLPKFNLKELF